MDLLERFKLGAIQISPKQDECEAENFDSPNCSKWIVAVDDQGCVQVLSRPNIHYSFFDNGDSAEEIGLPEESEDTPGIYEWTCILIIRKDWETGIDDDYEFEVTESKLLWTWVKDGEANEGGDKKTQSDSGSAEL